MVKLYIHNIALYFYGRECFSVFPLEPQLLAVPSQQLQETKLRRRSVPKGGNFVGPGLTVWPPKWNIIWYHDIISSSRWVKCINIWQVRFPLNPQGPGLGLKVKDWKMRSEASFFLIDKLQLHLMSTSIWRYWNWYNLNSFKKHTYCTSSKAIQNGFIPSPHVDTLWHGSWLFKDFAFYPRHSMYGYCICMVYLWYL